MRGRPRWPRDFRSEISCALVTICNSTGIFFYIPSRIDS
jgi:hypothetical protein